MAQGRDFWHANSYQDQTVDMGHIYEGSGQKNVVSIFRLSVCVSVGPSVTIVTFFNYGQTGMPREAIFGMHIHMMPRNYIMSSKNL